MCCQHVNTLVSETVALYLAVSQRLRSVAGDEWHLWCGQDKEKTGDKEEATLSASVVASLVSTFAEYWALYDYKIVRSQWNAWKKQVTTQMSLACTDPTSAGCTCDRDHWDRC